VGTGIDYEIKSFGVVTATLVKKGFPFDTTPFDRTTPTKDLQMIKREAAWFQQQDELKPEFKYINQPDIACHGGTIPRSLFYRSFSTPVTDRWLYAQVACSLTRAGLLEGLKEKREEKLKKTTIENWSKIISAIITGIIGAITYRTLYQYDNYGPSLETSFPCENFSNPLVLYRGDCEDMAWANASLLCALQRRETGGKGGKKSGLTTEELKILDHCTEMMRCYVVTNVLCQAQAPALKDVHMREGTAQYNDRKTAREESVEIDDSYHVYHMTCIVYPITTFLSSIEGEGLGKPSDFIPGNPWLLLREEEEKVDFGSRFYAEGTTAIYPDPCEEFNGITDLLWGILQGQIIGNNDAGLMAISNNTPTDNDPYGAIFQVMTDFFCYHQKKKASPTLFVCKFTSTDGTIKGLSACPEQFFCDSTKGKFSLLPSFFVAYSPETMRKLTMEPMAGVMDCDLEKFRNDLTIFKEKIIKNKSFGERIFGWYSSITHTDWACLPGLLGVYLNYPS
jgi:hypothetical protein